MKTVGMWIIGLLVVGALAFWIRATVPLPHIQVPTIASLIGTSTSSATLTASVGNSGNDNYVDLTGTVLLDTTGGTPVPFLEYTDAKNHVATKQLVYANSRACAAYAGDLPCVDVNPEQGYPEFPTGTAVEVKGEHVDDRILVYQISTL